MIDPLADDLIATVEAAAARLRVLPEAAVSARPAPGKWSRKEILGHLIDSAANNHHRFVRAQDADPFVFPKYEQEAWVSRQGYAGGSWIELIELWRLYNRHLARVIRRIPAARLGVACRIGSNEPVTLAYLIEDYLAHLKHHLSQLVQEP